MTTKEMIEVMQAYEDGKTIECSIRGGEKWYEIDDLHWNWDDFDYRVKPEKTFRPYIDTAEMVADWKERFCAKDWPAHSMPLIWLKRKDDGSKVFVCDFYKNALGTRAEFFHIDVALESFTYLDGSPCGKEIS